MSAMAVKHNRSNMICTHYGKSGHTKDCCYKIIGFPASFKFNRDRTNSSLTANQVT
ncbi:conserved hypothetical protein [Ricinus communis]|uniref:Uncharacterized protein n=1 Tax=Ricinus communis TaxID=3988 RepID=B9RXU1_RICCO|nr:conserved hypothetical protein [Ricinus communis]